MDHLQAKTNTGEAYYKEVGNEILEEAKQKNYKGY